MTASITKQTVSINRAAKLYTNNTEKDVIATLNVVSQDPLKNPTISLKYSSTSDTALNSIINEFSGGTPSAAVGPVSLGIPTSNANSQWAMNLNSNNYGTHTDFTGSGFSANRVTECLVFDPYYFVDPSQWTGESTAFVKAHNQSNSVYGFADGVTVMNNDPNLYWMSGSTIPSGSAYSTALTYYDYGYAQCMYSWIGIGLSSSCYQTIDIVFNKGGSYTYADQSTNGGMYNCMGGNSMSSFWAQTWSPYNNAILCDRGYFFSNCGSYGNYTCVQKVWDYECFSDPSATSSFTNAIANPNYYYFSTTTQGTVNWLKYNPFNETYYFYVNGASDDMGLYSFTESFEPHNSLAGVSTNVALCTQFTKISSFSGIPGGAKMTIPVRIAYGTWMSYDSNGNPYFTSDLITWKTLANYDAGSADISGAKLFNEDSNQKRFYLDASNTLKSIDTGFAGISLDGQIENKTQVGNYERSGLIIPKGESLYMENTGTCNVSTSVLAMSI